MVEQVYLAALDTVRKPVTVHVFPARMDSPSWPEWSAGQIAASPALEGFWNQLRPAYYYFEQTRRLPAIVVDADGIYRTMAR
jgi:murein L,D-transpeptidase YafK